MKIAEWFAGDTKSNLEHDELARESRRMCQEIRTYQNIVAFALVSAVGLVYVVSLWHLTDSTALLIWYLIFSTLTIVRACVYESVRKSLAAASATDLLNNEISLAVTGVIVSVVFGLSYWIVGIPGDERTVLAITVLSCVYATGATINAATQTRHLLVYLIAILGQSILFWIGFGNRTDYAMTLLLICLFLLLYAFALRNRAFIIESVKIRLQNKAHNERLIENRSLVEAALESALEANREKSHFIAAVSHDLAQPIHALSYLLGSLKSSADDEHRRADIVNKIEASIGLLDRQFEGFVDLARYDASVLDVQHKKFDLLSVCQLVVENSRAKSAKNSVKIIVCGQSVLVTSDAVLLGRIVGNLLDNAIKFGAGGQVQLDLKHHDDWVAVEVRDSGIGIHAENLPKIFGDFVRLDQKNQESTPGAGLGLAIVRRIALALEVEVFVDSTPGKGTIFTLLVPAKWPRGKLSDQTLPTVAGQSIREFTDNENSLAVPKIELHGKLILLAGHGLDRTLGLERYITDLGGQTVSAVNGDQTLLLARENNVDLAIVYDRIDGNSGWLQLGTELADLLGHDRVVMVTAQASGQRLHEIEKSGLGVYWSPLSWSKLQAILSSRLGIGLN